MKKINFIVTSTLLSTTALFAQKVNETGAALEYNSFEMCVAQAMQRQDMKAMGDCKDTYLKAKDYIDKAASHPATENNGKTLFYKGKIYLGATYAYANDTAYVNANKELFEEYFEIGLASLKKAHADKKMKKDVETFITQNVFQLNMGASQMFNDKKYLEAGGLYEMTYRLNDVIGKIDSTSLYNAGVSYQAAESFEASADKFVKLAEIGYKPAESYANAITNLTEAQKLDKVKELIETAIKKYPNDRDVLIAGVNYYFNVNDMESAEGLLNKAVEQDPNNHVLLYNIGTITLNQGNFDKAESSLKRAIEVKSDYTDAYYQLGAVYINKYAHIVGQMDELRETDPRYKELEKQADEAIKNAVEPLEKYLEKNPNDKETLLNMVKVYRSTGNNEKAIEYKKRADEL